MAIETQQQKETYYLVKRNRFDSPDWYLDAGEWWEDIEHEQWKKRDQDIVLESVQAQSFMALDFTKTGLSVPESFCGWLSPAGKFYGCREFSHTRYAWLVLGTTERALEQTGWVKIASSKLAHSFRRQPTDAQMQYIERTGRRLMESSY